MTDTSPIKAIAVAPSTDDARGSGWSTGQNHTPGAIVSRAKTRRDTGYAASAIATSAT